MMKVFLGDDSQKDLESLEKMLLELGHSISQKSVKVDDLLAPRNSTDPDMVIVDVFMGKFPGGFEVGEAWKRKNVPVVYTLDKNPEEDLVSKYPGNVWLTKPIMSDELKRAIEKAVGQSRIMSDDNMLVVEPINILATKTTPAVRADKESDELEIRGTSIPEDASWFYKNIADWIEQYAKATGRDLVINIILEYYNTNTQQALNVMFDVCARIAKQYDMNIVVKWHYESDDLDMEEAGEDLQRRLPLDVELVASERIDFKG